MLLLIDQPGQLCNRLWSFAPFIAYAMRHRLELRVLFFHPYRELFADLDQVDHVRFLPYPNHRYLDPTRLYKLTERWPGLLSGALNLRTFADLAGNPQHLLQAARHGTVLVESWDAALPQRYLQQFHGPLTELFRPDDRYVQRVDRLLNAHRRQDELLIGVHLRRGDFRTYRDGQFYYPDEVYTNCMQQLTDLFPAHHLRFLLCSNEPINPASFHAYATFSQPDAEGIEDLHALSRCDYLIGPPSTFSMWASFYGRVPLQFIHGPGTVLSRQAFSVIVARDVFADGTTLLLDPQGPVPGP